jgi:hypothetical protein
MHQTLSKPVAAMLAMVMPVLAVVALSFGSAEPAAASPVTVEAPASVDTAASPQQAGSAAFARSARAVTGFWEDVAACAVSVYGAVKSGVSPLTVLTLAAAAPACVRAFGNINAGYICWASRQWWGGFYRWEVSLITGGRYSRC